MGLRLVPVSFSQARQYVAREHRHNDPPVAVRASVGIEDESGTLRGVGMLGLPKARMSDDGRTAEVVRVATDGVANGCSMLYGALTRIAWGMGYTRLVTYTLDSESGASLRASGWTCEGPAGGGSWERGGDAARGRSLTAAAKPVLFDEYAPKVPEGTKLRWSKHKGTKP